MEATVTTALREQLMLLAEEVTVGELSYSELLTTKRTYINGPLAVFKRHLAKMTKFSKTFNMWQEGDADPPETIRYVDAEFQEYERGDLHSGVLTMAGFTLRFQTNRGRANRARTVFMGKYFEPPAAAESGCDPTHPDPMQQCYCQHCHTTLEPMAAYWGKISEAGSALLPISDFPHELPCANPNDPTEAALCAQFYVNDVEQEGFGMRLPLQWADGPTDDHQRLRSNFDAGPSALAATITDTDNGPFFETTVKTLWRYFMRRDMNLNPLDPDNEIALLDELTQTLRETDDFRTLVREIVLLDQYRRMR